MPLPLLGRLAGGGLSRAASRTASKVGKDPARRAAAQKRLKRMGRKKFARDFLEGAMQSRGLNTERIARNSQSGAGRLLRAVGYNPGSEGFDFNSPSLDSPERATPISNPSISSIENQLKEIAKTATDLGVISKKQQDQLLKDAIRTEAAMKEQQLEQPDATPIAAEGPGTDIGPADSAVEKLLEAISSLQEEIDNKVRDAQENSFGNKFMEGFLDSLGLGGVNKSRAAKRKLPQLRRGFREVAGGGYQNIKTGKFAAADDALKNFKTVDPKYLTQAAKGRQATAVLGKSSGKVAGALGSAVAKTKAGVGAATKIGKDAIAKIAKPLVSKSLVKTGIKAIPIVGAAAGGLFALGRLLKGDVVGAGLEATSGLAGPLTAIPALVLSLARDVYTGTFGVAPETDPLVGQRMTMVKDVVTELAEQELGKKVTKQSDKPAAASQAKAPAIPPAPQVKQPGAPPAAQVSAPSAAATATSASGGGAGGGGGGAASTAGGATTQSAPSTSPEGGTPQQVAAEGAAKKLEGEEGAAPPASGSAPEVKSATGEKILQASTEQPPSPSATGAMGSAPPKPATLPTTKGRAKGMGDVPEPTYLNLGSIAKQLYFGSVAGVMAS